MDVPTFIPGDRIIGTKNEFWKRRGSVAESHKAIPKTKILIRWDGDDFDEIVPRASIAKVEGQGSFEEDHSDETRSETSGSESSPQESLQETQQDEIFDEEVATEDSGENDDSTVEEDISDNLSLSSPLPVAAQPTNPPNGDGGRGRGGRGSQNGHGLGRGPGPGRGRGRGGGRGRGSEVPSNDLITPNEEAKTEEEEVPLLHAILKKGGKTTKPLVREWQEVPNVVHDLHNGYPTHDHYTRLNWRDPAIGIFPPHLDIPPILNVGCFTWEHREKANW